MPAEGRRDAIGPARLAELLADPEWCEAPVSDGASPLVVVDVSGPGDMAELAGLAKDAGLAGQTDPVVGEPAPAPWRVLVGVVDAPTQDAAPGLLDVCLCSGTAGDGWVRVPDLDTAVTIAHEACTASPRAAGVLTQVLRLNEGRGPAAGLATESLAYSMLLSGSEFRMWREGHPARAPRPSPDPVTTHWDDEAVQIVLNRPEVRNAYDPAMRDALVDALRAVGSHPARMEVRLTGAGPDFCSGGDLSWFGAAVDATEAHAVRTARSPGPLLSALGAITSVHGACVGAGIELPAFCPRIEAHPDSWFQLPEVSMGLIPGAGGTASILARIGRRRLAWMALSGVRVDAAEALSWGLIDVIT